MAGVVTGSVVVVTAGVLRIAYLQPRHTLIAVVATVAYLPLLFRQMRHSANGTRPPGAGWSLAAMAVIVAAVFPVIGLHWLGALYPLATSVLLVVPLPWSLAIFAGLAAVPVPVAFAYGQPTWAGYFALGVAFFGPMLAVPVWLVAAVRELQAARVRLADEAVVRERLRIDAELHRDLGTALERIATTGDRAVELSTAQAAEDLRDIVSAARTTLAKARRMVARFRHTPMTAELNTAVNLLRAAGMDAELVLPPAGLPSGRSEALLVTLRAEVARLLADESVRHCVIEVLDDRVRVTTDGVVAG